ncbi:MAG: pre-peptidase C-terminal domain-containing protein [Planctomycetota bacterium]|nr:pre-peptidase C-terminal domain-containing protein [Planctomycetota bacterium]
MSVADPAQYAVVAVAEPAARVSLLKTIPNGTRLEGGRFLSMPVPKLLERLKCLTAAPATFADVLKAQGLAAPATLYLTKKGGVLKAEAGLPEVEKVSAFLTVLCDLDKLALEKRKEVVKKLADLNAIAGRERVAEVAEALAGYRREANSGDIDALLGMEAGSARLANAVALRATTNAKYLSLGGNAKGALDKLSALSKDFAGFAEALSAVEAARKELEGGEPGALLGEWWHGGVLGAVYYTGKGAQKLGAFEALGKRISQKLKLPYQEIHAADLLGRSNDANGILLYPDGAARARFFIMPGGQAHDTWNELKEPGRKLLMGAFQNGMNYIGSCGGCWAASSGWDVKNALCTQFCLWPGKLNAKGPARQDPPPDIVLAPFHPLAKAAPGGVLKGVFFNGGPTEMTLNVPSTEYIGRFEGGGHPELPGKPALIAYCPPDARGGRLVVCAAHPETKFPAFMDAMADYAIDHPYALPRNPLASGAAVQGVSGDKQLQYYEIKVTDGARKLEIVLTGLDGNVDLWVRHGQPPNLAASDARSANPGTADEKVSLAPKPGVYFIVVYGNHEALSGVKYTLTASLETPATK